MKIKKAVIPAAGLGTRFLPTTKSLAKEMLPIVDKPCIQYLVEEAVESGIEEVIIITGDGKESIEHYFAHSNKLHKHLIEKGNKKAANDLKKIEKMAKFTFTEQASPKGDGHALLCAKHLIKNEPFAVLFGDDIWDAKIPPLKQMIKAYNKHKSPVVAVTKINKKHSEKYGIIDPENKNGPIYKVKNLVEKPTPQKAPSNLALTGKYIVTPELFEQLKKTKAKRNQELRLIDGMKEFIKSFPIYALELEGERFDTGDKLGYLKAVVNFTLKTPHLKKDFKAYLKSLLS
ncbi:UTP--glucose-1-phosphate uridylyltransferase [Candidatus Peregrinibacteria bacterium]|mgnify:CR=1 FL=1|jgi:UTP--glucose-1-phosphate uridylyltransferase|nr:UTP--glucose-1-phosphate uridylyltransferase [Candidatus Peregrinibacteria bacterium]MBT7736344.1 UTP--glucose-1-phosphate uridylyltransferase [Candidatus Peregrinibacteria bacterium]